MPLPLCSIETDSEGNRYSVMEWEGQGIRVYDGADTALMLIRLLRAEDVLPEAKWPVVYDLLFVDPAAVLARPWEDVDGMLTHIVYEVCGVDMDGSRGDFGKRVIDWEADGDYIAASVWQSYGVPVREIAHECTFAEFGRLVGLCPYETPIGQAIYYRTADEPKSTKWNQDQIEEFRKRRRAWALDAPQGGTSSFEAQNNDATLAFEGLKASIVRGK